MLQAWQYAVETEQLGYIAQALPSLWEYHIHRGYYQVGERRLAQLTAQLSTPVDQVNSLSEKNLQLLLRGLHWQSRFYEKVGQIEEALHLLHQGLTLASRVTLGNLNIQEVKARILLQMGGIHFWLGNTDKATGLLRQSLTIYQQANNASGIADAKLQLSKIAWQVGDYPRVKQLCEECLEIYEILNDQQGRAEVYDKLALVAEYQGRLADSERLRHQEITINETIGIQGDIVNGYGYLGITLWQGADLGRHAKLIIIV